MNFDEYLREVGGTITDPMIVVIEGEDEELLTYASFSDEREIKRIHGIIREEWTEDTPYRKDAIEWQPSSTPGRARLVFKNSCLAKRVYEALTEKQFEDAIELTFSMKFLGEG